MTTQMAHQRSIQFGIAAVLVVALVTAGAPIAAQQPTTGAQSSLAALGDSFRSSPVMFIENAGQWDTRARFQVLGATAGTMWLAEDAIWLSVVERSTDDVAGPRADRLNRSGPKSEDMPRKAANIKLSFIGANPHPRIEPFDRLDTVVSYFIGGEPNKWRPEVPVWGGVRYVDVYPGVDLDVTSEGGQMVQRLAARPGTDLSTVRLRVEGTDNVAVDEDALRLATAAGEVAWPLLQAIGSNGNARIQPRGVQVFDVATPLAVPNVSPQSVIDNPADLLYGTYLGGSSLEQSNHHGIAVDGTSSAYVTSWSQSVDFPSTPGTFDPSQNGSADAFVVKLNPAGSGLAYATFLGGSSWDTGTSIAVDTAGSAYVTGITSSSGFPTTTGAFDRSYNGGSYDTFVAKLDPAGRALVYATFLGGSGYDESSGIAVDGAGNAYLTGDTPSADFPATSGALDRSLNGGYDAFVAKLNSVGSGLAYSTFLGGGGADYGDGIAVDGTGGAHVMGTTSSIDFPTTASAFDRSYNGGDYDSFVITLNPTGSGLAYSTLLGGNGSEDSRAIALDGARNIYVTGGTGSLDFPTTMGAFDTSFNGANSDAFVIKLDPAGSGLTYATFLGGSCGESAMAIALDEARNAYVTGTTCSSDFPTTPGSFDRSINSFDAFVVKLDALGNELPYSTFLGGAEEDSGYGIAVDGAGSAYVTGSTWSLDFPTTPGAFDRSHNGGYSDAYVVKLAMGAPPTYSISGRVTDASGYGIPGVTVSAGSALYTTTNTDGYYTLYGLPARTYSLTPTKYLYGFSPASRTVTVPPDASGQDFVLAPIVDLRVDHIEVSQTFIEGLDPVGLGSIPLIGEKDALVRVFVGVIGATSVDGVTARLHLRDGVGNTYTDARPVNLWPVNAKQSPDRFDLQDTVNFRPPLQWLRGDVTMWADVDPNNYIPETNESNNTSAENVVKFQPGKQLRIATTQIPYTDTLGRRLYADWNTLAYADTVLRQLYPVGRNDVHYFYQPGSPDPVSCFLVKQGECFARLRTSMNKFWKQMEAGPWKTQAPQVLVGWVPGVARRAGSDCGQAARGDRPVVALMDYCDKTFGNPPKLTPVSVQGVFAHEVAHNQKPSVPQLQHTPNEDLSQDSHCFAIPSQPNDSYPKPAGLPLGSILAHGLLVDAKSAVFYPNSGPGHPDPTYDFMSYCQPSWISPYNYRKLNDGFEGYVPEQPSLAIAGAATQQLLVSGRVTTPTLQADLDPFYPLTSDKPVDTSTGSDFCLESLADSGAILHRICFDLAFQSFESNEPLSEDDFVFTIPALAGMAEVRLSHSGTTIASRSVSAHAPTAQLTYPMGGETWSGTGTHTVMWSAADLDNDTLHAALDYSIDNGATWIPVAGAISGNQYVLDVSRLPGSKAAKLRVSVTDGANTAQSASAGTFLVGSKAPEAAILSPTNGTGFTPGVPIWLEGRAFDLEDGELPDSAYHWSSDKDGDLGTGGTNLVTLSPSSHVISLKVTDSDGNTAVRTIQISVGDRVFLPTLMRGQ